MDTRTLRLLAVALVVTGSAAIHLALRSWIGRRQRAEEARRDPRVAPAGRPPWVALALGTLAPPLLLWLWLNGALVGSRMLLPLAGAVDLDRWYGAIAWTYRLGSLGLLLWMLVRFGRFVDRFARWQASRTANRWDDLVLPVLGKSARVLLPLVGVILGAPALGTAPALQAIVRDSTSLLLIGAAGYLLLEFVSAAAALLRQRHRMDVQDNLEARAVHTQILVLQRIAQAVILIFSLASMLMVFEPVRQFGASLLASAGLAGLVVGLAAQRSIATFIAGLQIAVTQPIRVDDVVVVEGEWGHIEEITLTYVVVRIWDLRRLVLPISYFIERPFQNWTRSSADVLASVVLPVDYGVPVERLRERFTEILQRSTFWDGKVNVLQVTDARDHVMEIRALASAASGSLAWDLRCEVREKLLAFIGEHYPSALPRLRLRIDPPGRVDRTPAEGA